MIPPKRSAQFVWRMEVLLDLYEEPYDPLPPVPCFDERPCQRVDEVREPLPMRPRDAVRRFDHEYRRGGIRYVHVAFEPLTGWRGAIILLSVGVSRNSPKRYATWLRRSTRKPNESALFAMRG